jgi:hypothetical protein
MQCTVYTAGFEFEVEIEKNGEKLLFTCHATDQVIVTYQLPLTFTLGTAVTLTALLSC